MILTSKQWLSQIWHDYIINQTMTLNKAIDYNKDLECDIFNETELNLDLFDQLESNMAYEWTIINHLDHK